MITACSHCGSKFRLPDKMLGRSAKCKHCSEIFLITPAPGYEAAEDAIKPPQRTGSTAQLNPVLSYEASDDPLDALANAAVDEDEVQRTIRHAEARSYSVDDDGRQGRHRKARGAGLAMGMGIAASVFTVAALVCGIITMTAGDNQGLIKTMGVISILLVSVGIVLAMIAVVNGTSASRSIRRARHPLSGQSQAQTGSIAGGIAMLLLVGLVIGGSIWLINRGGLQFQETIIEGANP